MSRSAEPAPVKLRGASDDVLRHGTALIGFTIVFLAAAVHACRRDDGRTWG